MGEILAQGQIHFSTPGRLATWRATASPAIGGSVDELLKQIDGVVEEGVHQIIVIGRCDPPLVDKLAAAWIAAKGMTQSGTLSVLYKDPPSGRTFHLKLGKQ